jgi:hypothetical protein
MGAIFGSAIPLPRTLAQPWQFMVLGGALILLLLILLLLFRRGVVLTLLSAWATGGLVALTVSSALH